MLFSSILGCVRWSGAAKHLPVQVKYSHIDLLLRHDEDRQSTRLHNPPSSDRIKDNSHKTASLI